MEYITLLGAKVWHQALNAINNASNFLVNNPIIPVMVVLGVVLLLWALSRA